MAEFRQSVLPRRVIVSAARGDRPHDIFSDHKSSTGSSCPFCRNHEHETGAETFAIRDSDVVCAPDWRVRVVYNKFPAVDPSQPCSSSDGEPSSRQRFPGFGAHEVVVETPDHGVQFADLAIAQVELILQAFRHRLKALKSDQRFQYVQIFKNNGKDAGASLRHSHSQIIALPMVPDEISCQVSSARDFFHRKGCCWICDSVKHDLCEGSRLIDQSSSFVSVAPFAAGFPYETWIIPTKHSSNFEETSDSELEDLARLLQLSAKKLVQLFPDASYNYVLYTNPFVEDTTSKYFHWYISLFPRLGVLGGFELATGLYINAVTPEKAAQELRD